MKNKLISELTKQGVKITKNGLIRREDIATVLGKSKEIENNLAKKIAMGWACDFIAAAADLSKYRDEFIKPQEDILQTIPAALDKAGLNIEKYLDIETAKNLVSKINEEWQSKLTVHDLSEKFGDDVLNYVSFQAAGFGSGIEEFPGVTSFLQEKGVSNFKYRISDPGFKKAQSALNDFSIKISKEKTSGLKKENSNASKEIEFWVTYQGGYEYGPFESEDDAKYAATVADKIDKENITKYRAGTLEDEPESVKHFYQQKIEEIENKMASRRIKKLG